MTGAFYRFVASHFRRYHGSDGVFAPCNVNTVTAQHFCWKARGICWKFISVQDRLDDGGIEKVQVGTYSDGRGDCIYRVLVKDQV